MQHSRFISNVHLPYSAKQWQGKTMANLANQKQFAKVFPHHRFALYGISQKYEFKNEVGFGLSAKFTYLTFVHIWFTYTSCKQLHAKNTFNNFVGSNLRLWPSFNAPAKNVTPSNIYFCSLSIYPVFFCKWHSKIHLCPQTGYTICNGLCMVP